MALLPYGDRRGVKGPSMEFPFFRPSPSQRETIYQSISKTLKNNAAPIGFRSAVPKGIDLAPLPETLSEMIPEERGYEAVIVEKRTLLVDPTSRVVIAPMTGE
jgi:hypothetical protein